MLGPILRGQLITLEPARKEFLPEFIGWFADTEVTRYLLSRFPLSLKQEEEWFENTSQDRNTVHWTIMLGERPVGVSGIVAIDWISRGAKTGTIIGVKSEWGKGYATESVRLRTAFAFQELGLERLESESFAVNAGMHKALERSGYRRIGTRSRARFREGAWHDSVIFELLRSDWETSQAKT